MKPPPTPRLSSGVIVVRRGSSGWLFLMLRAYRNWDFPKGLVEEGEDALAAARREVQEETLIEELHFDWGERFIETAPYNRNKVARYYVAQTRTARVTLPVNADLGTPEHQEWRWVSFEEAMSLVSPRVAPVVEWARAVVLGLAPHD